LQSYFGRAYPSSLSDKILGLKNLQAAAYHDDEDFMGKTALTLDTNSAVGEFVNSDTS
jgi:hypothetical protein